MPVVTIAGLADTEMQSHTVLMSNHLGYRGDFFMQFLNTLHLVI